MIGYRLMIFNDCETAAEELKEVLKFVHFLNCIYSYNTCIITIGDKASQEGFDIKGDETLAIKFNKKNINFYFYNSILQ